jgi:transcriptional regulator with PAS, ATPase and Fis domain
MSPLLDFATSEFARPAATVVAGWEAPGERAVGASDVWKDGMKRAALVAPTEATVLLTGESGTGKEVIARFVHRASTRRRGPFVAINCAALPEQLLESELFGYERGAFTGAQQAKPGQMELAAGGALLLDEVSEMSLSAQAKFLRVLQEREFHRRALLDYDWPGNVRELHNALERAAIVSEGEPIVAAHLSLPPVGRSRGATSDLNVFERETIEQIMRDSGGNKSRAARRLGLTRTQLYVRLRKHHLEDVVRSSEFAEER